MVIVFKVKPDLGTHCKSLGSKLKHLKQTSLNQHATEFLIGCCTYLINCLPMENQVVQDTRCLQFSKIEKKSSLSAISQLSLIIGKTLGNEAIQSYIVNCIKT